MNKPYIEENWSEIFENYFCGMSQRELEKKYFPITMRTINRTCKTIMVYMMTNPSSIMRNNWMAITKEINKIIKGIDS